MRLHVEINGQDYTSYVAYDPIRLDWNENAPRLLALDHYLIKWITPRSERAFHRSLLITALRMRGMANPKRRVLLRVLARRRAGKGRM